jgi:hypothetical protein
LFAGCIFGDALIWLGVTVGGFPRADIDRRLDRRRELGV